MQSSLIALTDLHFYFKQVGPSVLSNTIGKEGAEPCTPSYPMNEYVVAVACTGTSKLLYQLDLVLVGSQLLTGGVHTLDPQLQVTGNLWLHCLTVRQCVYHLISRGLQHHLLAEYNGTHKSIVRCDEFLFYIERLLIPVHQLRTIINYQTHLS